MEQKNSGISVFQRYLTIWVALCMVVGVLIGRFLPQIPEFLNQFEYAGISISSLKSRLLSTGSIASRLSYVFE